MEVVAQRSEPDGEPIALEVPGPVAAVAFSAFEGGPPLDERPVPLGDRGDPQGRAVVLHGERCRLAELVAVEAVSVGVREQPLPGGLPGCTDAADTPDGIPGLAVLHPRLYAGTRP